MEEAISILVVDDEPDIRRICRILLETGGYTVLEAATGVEAVETVRQHPELDLILMDIMGGTQSSLFLYISISLILSIPLNFKITRFLKYLTFSISSFLFSLPVSSRTYSRSRNLSASVVGNTFTSPRIPCVVVITPTFNKFSICRLL